MNKKLKFLLRDGSFLLGSIIIVITLFITIFAKQLVPYDPLKGIPKERLMAPFGVGANSGFHLLGTDYIGRDLLSRIFSGIYNSMTIGFITIALTVLIGLVIGLVSGLTYPGFLDSVLMRLTDIQMGFPFLLIALMVLSLVDPSVITIILVLSLASWPSYARIIRAGVIVEKEMDYVASARIMGANNFRIAFKYLAKNFIPSILPSVPMDLASIIIAEGLLSFLQLGIRPPGISLGNIMADGKNYIGTHWWVTALPGFVLMIIVLGLNLLADSMQSSSKKETKI